MSHATFRPFSGRAFRITGEAVVTVAHVPVSMPPPIDIDESAESDSDDDADMVSPALLVPFIDQAKRLRHELRSLMIESLFTYLEDTLIQEGDDLEKELSREIKYMEPNTTSGCISISRNHVDVQVRHLALFADRMGALRALVSLAAARATAPLASSASSLSAEVSAPASLVSASSSSAAASAPSPKRRRTSSSDSIF